MAAGRDRAADRWRAAKMLAIEPYLDRRPSELSGGQRQRVAIGRSIVRATCRCSCSTSRCPTSTPRCGSRPGRDQQAAPRAGDDDDLRHPRPGRGDDHGRAHRRAARRPAGAVRPAAGAVQPPGQQIRRQLHRLAADQHVRRHAGGADRDGAVFDAPGIGTVALPVDAGGLALGAAVSVGIRPSHLRLGGDGPVRLLVGSTARMSVLETYVYGAVEGAAESVRPACAGPALGRHRRGAARRCRRRPDAAMSSARMTAGPSPRWRRRRDHGRRRARSFRPRPSRRSPAACRGPQRRCICPSWRRGCGISP